MCRISSNGFVLSLQAAQTSNKLETMISTCKYVPSALVISLAGYYQPARIFIKATLCKTATEVAPSFVCVVLPCPANAVVPYAASYESTPAVHAPVNKPRNSILALVWHCTDL